MNNKKPTIRCPQCGRTSRIQSAGGYHKCGACGAMFDSEPDEGGDYSDRNPAARLEREERNRELHRRRVEGRV